MLQFIPVFDGNTVAVRATGKLSHEDYQSFLPKLEAQIDDLDKVSLLFELENFTGWDLDAAKDDYKFGMKHLNAFDRIAMVGDKAWEHWMALMAKPFLPSGEVRYFNHEDLQSAWDWLREKEESQQAAEVLKPYENIVVAVDFSKQSKRACKRAVELASYYKATLTVLNITQGPEFLMLYGDAIDGFLFEGDIIQKQSQRHLEIVESQMAAFISDLGTGCEIKTKVISGNKNTGIVSFLEAQRTDLVIFGTVKKKGINKLLGSTPHYVQNHSRCEMLIVRVQDSAF